MSFRLRKKPLSRTRVPGQQTEVKMVDKGTETLPEETPVSLCRVNGTYMYYANDVSKYIPPAEPVVTTRVPSIYKEDIVFDKEANRWVLMERSE